MNIRSCIVNCHSIIVLMGTFQPLRLSQYTIKKQLVQYCKTLFPYVLLAFKAEVSIACIFSNKLNASEQESSYSNQFGFFLFSFKGLQRCGHRSHPELRSPLLRHLPRLQKLLQVGHRVGIWSSSPARSTRSTLPDDVERWETT